MEQPRRRPELLRVLPPGSLPVLYESPSDREVRELGLHRVTIPSYAEALDGLMLPFSSKRPRARSIEPGSARNHPGRS